MQNFYFRNRTISAKEKIGKNGIISSIWHDNFAPSNKIGNCTNLFRMLEPKNEKDFCDKYFQYAEEHKELPISKRGLTYDEFTTLVNKYMIMGNTASDCDYDYDTYFNDALCHIITETYDGKIKELEFKKFLETLGYNCDYFDGSIDAKYGVDLKVTREDGKISAIQIKPISFFKSKRMDVRKDRISLIYKYHKFLKDYSCKTYYAIYYVNKENGCIFWLKNGNGYRFKIDELFTYDINDVYGTMKELPLKDDYHILGD